MTEKKKLGGVEETNRRLGRIEDTLTTASKVFELIHERLQHLDRGQERVIERLDRLVEASMRDRTAWVDRHGRIEERIERLESAVFPSSAPR